jgi:UDP-glucose 4-epimerase
MRIAITGGSGFIGSATVHAAKAAGHDVAIFDKAAGNDILGDLSGLAGAESVIHLAGVLGTSELFETPYEAIETNITGALQVLDWCRHHNAGYVGITLPPVFPSVYTATKLAADRFATAWHHAYGVPTATVRAFNVFGVGQKFGPGHPRKFLPTFSVAAWRGQPIEIWGDGEQTMDVVSADDLGRMLVDATGHGDDVLFDAGCGEEITVNDFAAFVLEVTGSTAGTVHSPMRLGEIPSRIKAEGNGWDRLGWRPTLDWDQVAEAIESYRALA